MTNSRTNLSQYIDHTLLKPNATADQITTLCQEAAKFNFFSVCIHSPFIQLAKKVLADSSVKVVTVVGFPLGCHLPEVKAFETKKSIELGADEIDMVINISDLKARQHGRVEEEIAMVVGAARSHPVKVIIETALLTAAEITLASQLSHKGGAHFVKTSTGFASRGASIEDLILMRKAIPDSMGLKASGGIKTYEQAAKMIAAGATRLGTSSGVDISKSS